MRLRGIRKNLYLLINARPDWNRKLLQVHRSFEEVRQLLEKNGQKAEKSAGKNSRKFC